MLKLVPTLCLCIKIAGAMWLIWLGIQAFKRRISPIADINTTDLSKQSFFNSILVEVLNSKTAMFFIAFLPQFIINSSAIPVWAQFLIYGVIVNLIFSSADIVCAFFAGWVKTFIQQSNHTQKLFQYLSRSIFIVLGMRLALSKD